MRMYLHQNRGLFPFQILCSKEIKMMEKSKKCMAFWVYFVVFSAFIL